MDQTLRIVVTLFALLFLIMGVNLMLAPVSGAEGIALGRLIGFVVDGNPTQPTVVAFGFELLITAVLVLASRKLPAKT